MGESSIPVDLFNPGQVFACMGFLEIAEGLLGESEGGFQWTDETNVRFVFRAAGKRPPAAVVLEFLAEARISCVDERSAETHGPTVNRLAAPIELLGSKRGEEYRFHLGHWADGSTRNPFKLYAGNRSADRIASAMLFGDQKKNTLGVRSLWAEHHQELSEDPFHLVTAMGGSFNFDARGAWTAIDAGYSPNDQKQGIVASPVVEILSAAGLEHSRPAEFGRRLFRYCAWGVPLPAPLARAALGLALLSLPTRMFQFRLALSGKNKISTYSEEISYE